MDMDNKVGVVAVQIDGLLYWIIGGREVVR